jgi:hypothetical protein
MKIVNSTGVVWGQSLINIEFAQGSAFPLAERLVLGEAEVSRSQGKCLLIR